MLVPAPCAGRMIPSRWGRSFELSPIKDSVWNSWDLLGAALRCLQPQSLDAEVWQQLNLRDAIWNWVIFHFLLSYWNCQFLKLIFWPCLCSFLRENDQKFISFQLSAFSSPAYTGKAESAPNRKICFLCIFLPQTRHYCCSTEPISSLSGKRIYCLIKK